MLIFAFNSCAVQLNCPTSFVALGKCIDIYKYIFRYGGYSHGLYHQFEIVCRIIVELKGSEVFNVCCCRPPRITPQRFIKIVKHKKRLFLAKGLFSLFPFLQSTLPRNFTDQTGERRVWEIVLFCYFEPDHPGILIVA